MFAFISTLAYKVHALIHWALDSLVRLFIHPDPESESGMSTIEYALGCVAAAALGALLYTIVTSDTVQQALSRIFEDALNQGK